MKPIPHCKNSGINGLAYVQSAYIMIKFGHKTVKRKELTPEGYSHDWEVYVCGLNKVKLDEIIKKVIFNIHEDYAKPHRVVKKPPYKVMESGYGGFDMTINIYFKCDDVEHQEYKIQYDLTYPENNEIIENHILLKAGASIQNVETKTSIYQPGGEKISKNGMKNNVKPKLINEGQNKRPNHVRHETPEVKPSSLECTSDQKHAHKKKKLKMADHPKIESDNLSEHRSKYENSSSLNTRLKNGKTSKEIKLAAKLASSSNRKSTASFNIALGSLITQSKDYSSDSELEDNFVKNSVKLSKMRKDVSFDKKSNGTMPKKKKFKKDKLDGHSAKNSFLSSIYDSESESEIKTNNTKFLNAANDRLPVNTDTINFNNDDKRIDVHDYFSQSTSSSPLNSQKSSSSSSSVDRYFKNPHDHARLAKLHQIIISLKDDELINGVADIVYASGNYEICKEVQKFQFKLEDLSQKTLCNLEKLVYK
ncbi:uncharacterized protein TRIADDRAFT_54575 [Trichoplax adhaerens]|uniref:YEATS domain-containing protein n=1 Tax=Trichoplax adhaerens TaxID=10228 RepID=B3RSF1_TRIAD|nr:hypothetical protein TRIADDRAFT_54575 [Trichoplax adhaerens]EDV27045.1 hypothetical protein TRIADDRAFT_54575 [Trichoplax adhaerens]|eukprot:XP_002111041.1 hypothetical protein TRIADDRAFT_54575 [Trichoplax adhaerens]